MKPAIRAALVWCGLLLGISIAATIAHRTGYIDQELTTRILMVSVGIMMAAFSSRSPKDEMKRTPRGIAISRFTGWAMTLASLGWTAIWLFAPIDNAEIWAMAPILLGGLAVLVRCLTLRSKPA